MGVVLLLEGFLCLLSTVVPGEQLAFLAFQQRLWPVCFRLRDSPPRPVSEPMRDSGFRKLGARRSDTERSTPSSRTISALLSHSQPLNS